MLQRAAAAGQEVLGKCPPLTSAARDMLTKGQNIKEYHFLKKQLSHWFVAPHHLASLEKLRKGVMGLCTLKPGQQRLLDCRKEIVSEPPLQ